MPPRRKKKAEKGSRGLAPSETISGSPTREIENTRAQIEADGGAVLGVFRDPLGGYWQLLTSLPIDKAEPTPSQQALSDTHVKPLAAVIDTLGRFPAPIIAVRSDKDVYWTPNGHHRLSAMKRLGAK